MSVFRLSEVLSRSEESDEHIYNIYETSTIFTVHLCTRSVLCWSWSSIKVSWCLQVHLHLSPTVNNQFFPKIQELFTNRFIKALQNTSKWFFAKYPFIYLQKPLILFFFKKKIGICDFYFRVTSVLIIFPRLMTSMVFLTVGGGSSFTTAVLALWFSPQRHPLSWRTTCMQLCRDVLLPNAKESWFKFSEYQ